MTSPTAAEYSWHDSTTNVQLTFNEHSTTGIAFTSYLTCGLNRFAYKLIEALFRKGTIHVLSMSDDTITYKMTYHPDKQRVVTRNTIEHVIESITIEARGSLITIETLNDLFFWLSQDGLSHMTFETTIDKRQTENLPDAKKPSWMPSIAIAILSLPAFFVVPPPMAQILRHYGVRDKTFLSWCKKHDSFVVIGSIRATQYWFDHPDKTFEQCFEVVSPR